MVDDPKKKKLDGKRIALGQKHEIDYLKKIAKEQMAELQIMKKGETSNKYSPTKCIRICKALLKCLK